MEDNITKINFFKKVWYSITKISKYEDMRKEGLGKSIKYILTLTLWLAIVLAIFATILQISISNKAISYLDEKLPQMKFKDNVLSIEDGDATILNEDEFKEYFKNAVVINTLLEKQEAVNQYKDLATENNDVLVFLSDKYIVISNKYNPENENEEGITTYNYSDISDKYIKDKSMEYTKTHLIEYLRNHSSATYYFAQFWIIYLVMITFIYFIYIILISAGIWLATKLAKFKWTFKDSLMNTIYAATLSEIIYVTYMIVSYYAKFSISFMDVISLLLIFVYIFIILWKDKKKSERVK